MDSLVSFYNDNGIVLLKSKYSAKTIEQHVDRDSVSSLHNGPTMSVYDWRQAVAWFVHYFPKRLAGDIAIVLLPTDSGNPGLLEHHDDIDDNDMTVLSIHQPGTV